MSHPTGFVSPPDAFALDPAVETDRFGMGAKISRGDVAAWLLDAVEQPGEIRDRTPMITGE